MNTSEVLLAKSWHSEHLRSRVWGHSQIRLWIWHCYLESLDFPCDKEIAAAFLHEFQKNRAESPTRQIWKPFLWRLFTIQPAIICNNIWASSFNVWTSSTGYQLVLEFQKIVTWVPNLIYLVTGKDEMVRSGWQFWNVKHTFEIPTRVTNVPLR